MSTPHIDDESAKVVGLSKSLLIKDFGISLHNIISIITPLVKTGHCMRSFIYHLSSFTSLYIRQAKAILVRCRATVETGPTTGGRGLGGGGVNIGYLPWKFHSKIGSLATIKSGANRQFHTIFGSGIHLSTPNGAI